MDIKNLEKFVKLCRKYGISELKLEGVELKLTSEPPKSPYKERQDKQTTIPGLNQYTEEDILFWSSGGVPSNNEVPNA